MREREREREKPHGQFVVNMTCINENTNTYFHINSNINNASIGKKIRKYKEIYKPLKIR